MDSIVIDPLLVTLIVSLVLPILVGFVTKVSASAPVKQAVSLFATIATTLIVTATTAEGVAIISEESAILAIFSFVTQLAAYRGIYRPNDANAKLAPKVGFGQTPAV